MILKLTDYAFRKLSTYVEHAKGEISGFGEVEYQSPGKSELEQIVGGYFLVTDLDILPQDAGYAHATISQQDYAKYVTEKVKQKKDVRKLRLWWHSHGYMEAFFSSTDTGTIDGSSEFEWLLSMVVNKKGSVVARVDVYNPRITREIEEVFFMSPDKKKKWTPKHTEEAKAEVEEKVKSALPALPAWRPNFPNFKSTKDEYHREIDLDVEEVIDPIDSRDSHQDSPRYVPRDTRVMLYRNGILVPVSRKKARKMARRLMWMTTQEMTPEEFKNWLRISAIQEDHIQGGMGFI